MKRKNVLTVGLIICGVILAAAVAMCAAGIAGLAGVDYPDADKYTVGDATIRQPVRNLDIDWTSGKVAVAYHSGSTVEVSEKSNGTIPEDRRLRWWLDGDTLRIRYAKPGIHLFVFSPVNKELTVALPEAVALEDVSICATSGTLDIPALQADNLSLKVTSGDILAGAKAHTVTADMTSGNIVLELTDDADEISVSSTSGDISVKGGNAGSFRTEATSGNIVVDIKDTIDFEVETTSGNIQAGLGKAGTIRTESTSGDADISASGVDRLDMSATSGDMTLFLPEEQGFTAELDTTSGRIEYELPLQQKDGEYIHGDGSAEVKINTTSGNIVIEAQ